MEVSSHMVGTNMILQASIFHKPSHNSTLCKIYWLIFMATVIDVVTMFYVQLGDCIHEPLSQFKI